MAANSDAAYGLDVKCVLDADVFWSTTTGLDLVYQDALHRILTNDVLGPGGVGWGYDVRQLLGMPTRELAAKQTMIAQVLQKDDRIQSATVTLTATVTRSMADVRFEGLCQTEFGPFPLVIPSILDVSAATIEGQAS